ncbi:MAG: HEAT repeat domain-containing protein [bacterium]
MPIINIKNHVHRASCILFKTFILLTCLTLIKLTNVSAQGNEKPIVDLSTRIETAIEALKSSQPTIRFNAVTDLKKFASQGMNSRGAVKALISALSDNDSYIKATAAETLGLLKAIEATKSLVAVLKDDDVTVQLKAAWALGELKASQAVDNLFDAASSTEDLKVKLEVAQALAKIKSPETIKLADKNLKSNDANLRFTTMVILNALQDNQTIESLILALKDENEDIKRIAIYTLKKLRDTKAVNPLIDLLAEKNKLIRKEALYALGEIQDIKAIDSLILSLKDKESDIQIVALTALRGLKYPQTIEALITALKKENDNNFKLQVIWLLKWLSKDLNDPQALAYYVDILKKVEPVIQEEIIEALAFFEDKKTIQPLIDLLKGEDEEVTHKASWCLTYLSGQMFRKDYNNWQDWWNKHKDDKLTVVKIGNDKKSDFFTLLEKVEKDFKNKQLKVTMTSSDDIIKLGEYKNLLAIPILAKIVEKYTDDLQPFEPLKIHPLQIKKTGCPFEIFSPHNTRINALHALGNIGHELTTVPYVKKALDDPESEVKVVAADVLYKLGSR